MKINTNLFRTIMSVPGVVRIYNAFEKEGYEIRMVGGAVRDIVKDVAPKDIDFATNAIPDEIMRVAKDADIKTIATGLQHGTVTLVVDEIPYEVTTLRRDTNCDGRHAKVEFTADWREDALRRDFKFNAMSLEKDGMLHDYFGGVDDLKKNIVQFVGDTDARIKEDYLRILRYFRFNARMPSPYFYQHELFYIKLNAPGLKKISVERVWMEMEKILDTPNAVLTFLTMRDTDVLSQIGIHDDHLNFNSLPSNNPKPVTKLVGFLKDDYAIRLSKYWKMAAADQKLIEYLVKNRDLPATPQNYRLEVVNGVHPMWVGELSKLHHAAFNAKEIIYTASLLKFPIFGQDLIDAGHKPGRQMGETLKKLKQDWIDSDYSLTKKELLEKLK